MFLVCGFSGTNALGIVASLCGLFLSIYVIVQEKIISQTTSYWAGHVDDIVFKASKVRDDMLELIEENKKLRFLLKQFEDDGK